MSKRYGRNQKRRHRERIAELEDLVRQGRVTRDFISMERDRLAAKLREQEAHVREIANTINDIVENSVLLPPDKFDYLRDTGDGDKMRYRRAQKEQLRVARRWTEADPIEA